MPPLNVRSIAEQFNWANVAIFGVVGLVGALLAEPAGFRPALDPAVAWRDRLTVPLLIGVGLGVLAVLVDRITNGTGFIEQQVGEASFNVFFPASLLVYTGGIVHVEATFRLFIFPLLMWLISGLVLRNRWPERVFWILAVVLSLLEPLGQGLGILFLSPVESFWGAFFGIFLPYFVTSYAINLTQAWLFWRRGLLASFALRLGYYAIWHIVYGSWLYPLWRA